jgi:hypothetical protein
MRILQPTEVQLGRCERGLRVTLGAMRDLGQLEPVDAALVAHIQSLAHWVDQFPADPGLQREYGHALERLHQLTANRGSASAIDRLLAQMGNPTPAATGDPGPGGSESR